MRYRKLDANGDYSFGHGASDYLVDSSAAVAQAIQTALALYQGEWFLDLSAGVPWLTAVVGNNTQPIYDGVIQQAIQAVEGVQDIQNYTSSLDNNLRTLSISVTVITQFSSKPVTVATVVQIGYGTGGYGEGGYGE